MLKNFCILYEKREKRFLRRAHFVRHVYLVKSHQARSAIEQFKTFNPGVSFIQVYEQYVPRRKKDVQH